MLGTLRGTFLSMVFSEILTRMISHPIASSFFCKPTVSTVQLKILICLVNISNTSVQLLK